MTKKHYEAIASNASEYLKLGELTEKHFGYFLEDLADYFQTDNPRFDRTRFLQACGIEQPPAIDYHPGAHHRDCATNSALKDINSRHYSGCYACGYTGR